MLRPLPADVLLVHGRGDLDHHTCCAMEAFAWAAGKPEAGDSHPDVCPVLRAVVIDLNDGYWWSGADERTRTLMPFVPRLAGTAGTLGLEMSRRDRAVLWSRQIGAPLMLRQASALVSLDHFTALRDHAAQLAKGPGRNLALYARAAAKRAADDHPYPIVQAAFNVCDAAASGSATDAAYVSGRCSSLDVETRHAARDSLLALLAELIAIKETP
jgi:hypothetical protein